MTALRSAHISRRMAAAVVLLMFVLFFAGPVVIHAGYRAATPERVFATRRAEYSRLATAELSLGGADRAESEKARYRLYLWFRARGFPIDQGHEALSMWEPWHELIAYWRS